MTDSYLTIKNACEGLYKSKGSRFLAYAYPLKSEEEAAAIVKSLKKKHHAARHHCYAWRMGTEGERFRINDDGEPSSTAGRPILRQIKRMELTNILVVVVRYFGGTLLGVSGLIKAYGEAASDALSHSEIVNRTVEVCFSVQFDYAQMNPVMKLFKEHGLPQIKAELGLKCKLITSVRKGEAERLTRLFRQLEGVEVRYPGSNFRK
ncbi:MAG: YigZ family protein [Mangrovibacterium sp.]